MGSDGVQHTGFDPAATERIGTADSPVIPKRAVSSFQRDRVNGAHRQEEMLKPHLRMAVFKTPYDVRATYRAVLPKQDLPYVGHVTRQTAEFS